MPFELGGTLRGGAEWTCGRPLFYGVLRNPVFTAALITALALVIVFALYRSELKRSGWQLGVKTGFWVLVATSAVVFVHYYALEKYFNKEHGNRGVREVVGAINASAVGGGGYRIPLSDEAGESRREGFPGEYRQPARSVRRYGAAEEEDDDSGDDDGDDDGDEEGESSSEGDGSSEETEDSVFNIQDAVLPSSQAPAAPALGGGSHRRHKRAMQKSKETKPPRPVKAHKAPKHGSKPYAPYRR